MSLIKIASAIDRAFLRGELTQKGLKTIKNNGMLRSKETILNGFKEGTKNIALKKGYKIKQGKELNFLEKLETLKGGGYTTNPMIKEIRSIGDSKLRYLSPTLFKLTNNKPGTIALRHEAYEAVEDGKGNLARLFKRATNKQLKKYDQNIQNIQNNKGIRGKFINFIDKQTGSHGSVKNSALETYQKMINNKIGRPTGNHFNLAVLGRESNDAKQFQMYNIKIPIMHKLRNMTGESNLLQRITGKTYGEHFNIKDLKKLRKAKHTGFLNDGLEQSGGFFHT
jgi:hypothetical protein